MSSRLRNPRIMTAITGLLTSVVCLAIVEAAARWLERRALSRPAPRTRLSLLQPNPNGTGSYRMKPHLDLVAQVKGLRVAIKTNSYGMRWREVTRPKAPGTTRVAFLGDSFTFGCWSDSVETSFVGVFERGLAPKRIEALNFGVGGYGLDDMELILKEEVAGFAPDVVVVMLFTGNDFRDTYLGLDKYDLVDGTVELNRANMAAKIPAYIHEDDAFTLPPARDPVWLRRSLTHLATARVALGHFGLNNPWLDLKPSRYFTSFSYWSQYPYPNVARRAVDVTLATLDRMNTFVGEHGGRLAVVAVPSREQVYSIATTGSFFDTALPQAHVLVYARDHDVPYLDLLPPLRRYAQEHWASVYVEGDIHFNTRGHQLAGEWIREWYLREVKGR